MTGHAQSKESFIEVNCFGECGRILIRRKGLKTPKCYYCRLKYNREYNKETHRLVLKKLKNPDIEKEVNRRVEREFKKLKNRLEKYGSLLRRKAPNVPKD